MEEEKPAQAGLGASSLEKAWRRHAPMNYEQRIHRDFYFSRTVLSDSGCTCTYVICTDMRKVLVFVFGNSSSNMCQSPVWGSFVYCAVLYWSETKKIDICFASCTCSWPVHMGTSLTNCNMCQNLGQPRWGGRYYGLGFRYQLIEFVWFLFLNERIRPSKTMGRSGPQVVEFLLGSG